MKQTAQARRYAEEATRTVERLGALHDRALRPGIAAGAHGEHVWAASAKVSPAARWSSLAPLLEALAELSRAPAWSR